MCNFFHSSAYIRHFGLFPAAQSKRIRLGTLAIALAAGMAASSPAAAQLAPGQSVNEETAAAFIAASINSTISTIDTIRWRPPTPYPQLPS